MKDPDKAASDWRQVITLTEREPGQRVLYLLAAEQRAALPQQAADNGLANRRLLIQKQLAEIEADFGRVKGDPSNKAERASVRIRCRDIVELYADESDPAIANGVRRAKEIMEQLPRT
jgi:hypothetical protein